LIAAKPIFLNGQGILHGSLLEDVLHFASNEAGVSTD